MTEVKSVISPISLKGLPGSSGFWLDSPVVKQVEKSLDRLDGPREHLLFAGSPGSGRSSLLRDILTLVTTNSRLRVRWAPVFFPEEMHHACSPGEILHEAVLHIAHDVDSSDFKEVARSLSGIGNDRELEIRSLETVNDFAQILGKRLLFLIDNLDILLDQTVSPATSDRLLNSLTRQPHIVVIGSATLPVQEPRLEKRFRVIPMTPLDSGQCCHLWKSEIGHRLSSTSVRPMVILTRGNPRFFKRLTEASPQGTQTFSSSGFMRLMEASADYFKARLTALPPLERKVFVCMADAWDPLSARVIAELSRMDVNKASAYLQRLTARGLVTVTAQQGRKKWYQIEDRLFNAYLLMSRKRGAYSRMCELLCFMELFYNKETVIGIGQLDSKDVIPVQSGPDRHLTPRETEFILQERATSCDGSSYLDQGGLVTDGPNSGLELSETEKTQRELTALETIEIEISQSPDSPNAWFKLGLFLMESKVRLQDAETVFKKTVSLKPDAWGAWFNVGLIAGSDPRRYSEARDAYEKSVSAAPENFKAWNNLAIVLAGMAGADLEAEQAFRKAATLRPDNAHVWFNLGVYYQHRGRLTEAESALKKAIDLDPGGHLAWTRLGFLLTDSTHRSGDAEKALERAVQQGSRDRDVLSTLLSSQIRSHRIPEALRTAEALLIVSGSNPDTLDGVAARFLNVRDIQGQHQALAWIGQALDSEPNRSRFNFTCAALLGAMGQWQQSLVKAPLFLNDDAFLRKELAPVILYLVSAARNLPLDSLERLLETSSSTEILDPVIAGIRIALNRHLYLAPEILAVGKDIAEAILDSRK
ncbi:MAG: tetratricopeptide repeat protein [Pseudomonadota bacterium]